MLPSYLFLRVTHLQWSLSRFMRNTLIEATILNPGHSYIPINLLVWLVIVSLTLKYKWIGILPILMTQDCKLSFSNQSFVIYIVKACYDLWHMTSSAHSWPHNRMWPTFQEKKREGIGKDLRSLPYQRLT